MCSRYYAYVSLQIPGDGRTYHHLPDLSTSSADVEGNLSMVYNRVAASVRLPEAMIACST